MLLFNIWSLCSVMLLFPMTMHRKGSGADASFSRGSQDALCLPRKCYRLRTKKLPDRYVNHACIMLRRAPAQTVKWSTTIRGSRRVNNPPLDIICRFLLTCGSGYFTFSKIHFVALMVILHYDGMLIMPVEPQSLGVYLQLYKCWLLLIKWNPQSFGIQM